jgi:hypothetical protein
MNSVEAIVIRDWARSVKASSNAFRLGGFWAANNAMSSVLYGGAASLAAVRRRRPQAG